MPELRAIPGGRVAVLAGIAPYDNEKGRRIDAGRGALQRCLYVAFLVAIRFCPHLRDFTSPSASSPRATQPRSP